MPQSGYIYILINPTLNGLVKIGKTSKTSEERAKELSSATGIPTQFMVAYDEFFEDIDLAESHVHEVLKNMGHHVFPNKEFFDIPLKEAIRVINETRKYFTNTFSSNTTSEEIFEEDEILISPYESILEEAYNYKYGSNGYFQDDYEALDFFEKAYNLGSGEACYELGYSYAHGEGCTQNKRTSLQYLKEGVKRNFPKCYILMYQIYKNLSENENANKCRNKILENLETSNDYNEYILFYQSLMDNLEYDDANKCLEIFFEKIKNINDTDRILILRSYLLNQSRNNQTINLQKIKPYLKDIIASFEKTIDERTKTENLDDPNVVSLLNRFRTIVNYLKKQ